MDPMMYGMLVYGVLRAMGARDGVVADVFSAMQLGGMPL